MPLLSDVYDYGFRLHNPGIARFFTPDPLEGKMPFISSYAYGFNNPISFVDTDGREPEGGGENVVIRSARGLGTGLYSQGKESAISNIGTAANPLLSSAMLVYGLSMAAVNYEQTGSNLMKLGVKTWTTIASGDAESRGILAGSTLVLAAEMYFAKGSGASGKAAKAAQAGNALERTALNGALEALDATKVGWKLGESIKNLTSTGNIPSWSTVRRRFWKNEAFSNGGDYLSGELNRMKKGLAPQRKNRETGLMESKELHHDPPQRSGGLFEFKALWPDEHKIIDRFRK